MSQPDPFGVERDRVRRAIDGAEAGLFSRMIDLFGRWAGRLHQAVFGTRRRPDPAGIFETEKWFADELEDVLVEVSEVFEHAHDDVTDDDPGGYRLARDFLAGRRNRLVRIPDSVYGQVTAAVFAADKAGEDTDVLAARIDAILEESGGERWTNRARTIARTEAAAAYNAGTFSGYLGYAAQMGGRWEKVWLDCDDDRVRLTHRAADGQRVPLILPFSVGGFPGMYPHDPELPARESVNCRCGMLLVRPGEEVDYSNRNFRQGA